MEIRRATGGVTHAGPFLVADRYFHESDLPALRALVEVQAGKAGATEDQIGALMIIANELATNAVMHAGGRGRLRLWRGSDHIVCEVSDTGPGLRPRFAGTQRPPVNAATGRGLWLVRRLAGGVEIDSGPGGTTVAARMALRPRSPRPQRSTPTGGAHAERY